MVESTMFAAGLDVRALSGKVASASTAKTGNQGRRFCIWLVGSFFKGRIQHTRGEWGAQLVRWRTMSAYALIVGRCRCMASAITSVYFRAEPVLKRTTRSWGVRKPEARRR